MQILKVKLVYFDFFYHYHNLHLFSNSPPGLLLYAHSLPLKFLGFIYQNIKEPKLYECTENIFKN